MLPIEITLDRITIPAGRRAVDSDAVERLKQSIVAVGLQHPITVRARGARHDGNRRHARTDRAGRPSAGVMTEAGQRDR
jgi:hypothetical protein